MLIKRHTRTEDYGIFQFYRRLRLQMWKVLSLTQEESLRARDRRTTYRIPLVTAHNSHTTFISLRANGHWYLLQSKERLARIFYQPPLIAYRRPKSLWGTLVSAKLRRKTPTRRGYLTTTGVCGSCNKPKCSWCTRINKISTGTGTQEDGIRIGNSMICSDIWHKYHEWYFEIVIRNFTSR